MADLKTVNDVLGIVTSRGDATVMMAQEKGGTWSPITSKSFMAGKGAGRCVSRVGVEEGGPGRDPFREQVGVGGYGLCDAGDRRGGCAAVCDADGGADRVHAAGLGGEGSRWCRLRSSTRSWMRWERTCRTWNVVVMDDGDHPDANHFSALMNDAKTKQGRDAAFDAMAGEVKPEDLATIIYTSGTTGEPKGVMLTHGNMASNMLYSTAPFGFNETDKCISFLPLSHVTARHEDYALMRDKAVLAYCAKFDQMPGAMKVVKPTIIVAVPRVYEKIRQAVEGRSVGLKKKILNWALGVGKAHRAETLAGKTPGGLGWKLADKLVFSKIREAFGGEAKVFVSGGAPLGMDSAGWFADVGIRIFEGYGLTETSPVVALNYPKAYKIGTVGKMLANVEVRIAADGEIEVHGPAVFKGYWKKEKETAEAFTEDGWFKTGDIGNVDADGYLSITDRKKELLKTSGGKLIAPQPIENKLKANGLVSNAAMVGDKHKFACVLISPNHAALESWATGQGISTGDKTALVKDDRVVKEYQRIVDGVNAGLANYESMKRVKVVPEEWSVEDGTLTPSMKLKRRVVEKKYEKEIAEFYADEATSKG